MSGLSVVVVGDSQCGKTQLINRFANGAFDQVNMSMVMVMLMVMMMVGNMMKYGGCGPLQVWQGSLDQQVRQRGF